MNSELKKDLLSFAEILETTTQEATRIILGLDQRPVAIQPQAIQPNAKQQAQLPSHGMGFQNTLAQFKQRFEPGFSGSAGPRYLGFVVGGTTPAALAGDWLTSALDNNAATGTDSVAPEVERETIFMLRELFGLSAEFFGSFVSGATMSNFVGLAIGREWLAEQFGRSIAAEGLCCLPQIKIFSGAAHSSTYKAASMLGIGRNNLQAVPLLPGRESVDIAELDKALADHAKPCIVVANAGTVNTVDFDDIQKIAALKSKYSFWLHVDAAFGAFAATSPKYSHLVRGLELADSVCIDAHKWLNVPYDSAMQFSKRQDLQVQVFQNSAAYLGLPTSNPDFVHLTPENSRRLRALPAWFALHAYGRAGVRETVEQNCQLAFELGQKILNSTEFTLLSDVRMNVVCFQPKNATAEKINLFLAALRDDGNVFLTPTVLFGQTAIRAAFSNWRTTTSDLEIVWASMQKIVRSIA